MPVTLARRGERFTSGEDPKGCWAISSGLPGSKLLSSKCPVRPDFRGVALTTRGRELKLLFHKEQKDCCGDDTQLQPLFDVPFPARRTAGC
jgi:hypothetical protein